jgi:NADPH-dependent 2,4-dienoyl-CoA reductase/sulfur reductase-like enzyme/nitrite reductase/ring-hydroxylating ferredoxin subunit
MAENWEAAAESSELEEGKPVKKKVGKRNVMLVRIDGKVHASGAKCPHYGAPLEKGVLIDHILACPWHTARFDLTTGKTVSPPALGDPAAYEAREEEGKVYIKKIPRSLEEVSPNEDTTFVLLGGGAAGCAAAMTLRDEGFKGRVVMVTRENDLPYDRPALSKAHMEGALEPKWLPLKDEDFYKKRAIEVMKNAEVDSVDTGSRQLRFSDGNTLSYDKLLIATGGVPKAPPIEGTGLDRFFLLRSKQDALNIGSVVEQAERAVILGASFIGMEAAASLASRGMEVQVAAPEEVPMARVFGERIGSYLMQGHEKKGVQFHMGVFAQEARENNGGIEVTLSDGSTLSGDLVIAGIGVAPAVGFLEGSGLVKEGAVPVDSTLKTSAENVYAAGDIAIVPDHLSGGSRRVEHWVEAQRQGQHAARVMLGSDEPFRQAPFFWTKQFDMALKYVGYAQGYNQIAYRGEVEQGSFLAGFYKGGRLLAAAAMGYVEDIIVAEEILNAGMQLSPEQLEDSNLSLRDVYAG